MSLLVGTPPCRVGNRLLLLLCMRLVSRVCSRPIILLNCLLLGLSFLSLPSALLIVRRLMTLRLIRDLLLLRRLCTVGQMHTLLVMERCMRSVTMMLVTLWGLNLLAFGTSSRLSRLLILWRLRASRLRMLRRWLAATRFFLWCYSVDVVCSFWPYILLMVCSSLGQLGII